MRLLVSARDPGAAHSLLPVLRGALADARFQVTAVAAGPAADILAAAGIDFRRCTVGAVRDAADPAAAVLLREADSLLRACAPQALLVGLSGPDAGIDEALLARAGGIPSFALQDYWGDVNAAFGRAADLYLVADAEAVRLSRDLHGVAAEAVGSPKYAAYATLDPAATRAAGRARLGLADGARLVGVFGQELWRFPGYRRTLRLLAEQLRAVAPDARLLYRPHPKETGGARGEALALLGCGGRSALADPGLGSLEAICACDIVGTVYSTTCYDAAHVNRVAAAPMAVPLYLLFEPDLQARIRDHTGIEYLPPAREGVCAAVREPAGLATALAQALSEDGRKAYWEAARRRLRGSDEAVGAILDIVLAGGRR